MSDKLTAERLSECQARCGEQCPMALYSSPDQVDSALAWLNDPPTPPLDTEGRDISGVPTNLKDAILRCSGRIFRTTCETPIQINKRIR